MDMIPAEIWGEIYTLACVDNGRTGRALSLVSRFIHETSKPYKLQSIAVKGERQLTAFADLIERTPTHLRRVNCLFISDRRNVIDFHRESIPKQDTVSRILRTISTDVRIIHAFLRSLRPFVFLPVSFPVLEELVVYGSIDTARDYSIHLTALKHLRIFGSKPIVFKTMLTQAPSLVNLQISATEYHAEEWSAIAKFGLPTHLQRILIQTQSQRILFHESHNRTMLSLRVLADADHRVTLLQSHRSSVQDAEATWKGSAAGIPWW